MHAGFSFEWVLPGHSGCSDAKWKLDLARVRPGGRKSGPVALTGFEEGTKPCAAGVSGERARGLQEILPAPLLKGRMRAGK